MAQYLTGSCSVTNNSVVVIGTGTLWLSNVSVGDLFTVVNSGVTYQVGSVSSDTSLSLTGPYQGVTASSISYVISRDFTPISGIPIINKGDVETSSLLKRLAMQLDGSASNTSAGASFDKQHNTDGTHKRFSALASSLDNTGSSSLSGPVTLGSTLSLGGVTRGSWGEDVISGTATSGTVNSITDTTKDLGVNSLAGMILSITGGTGAGEIRTISSNTSNTITVSSNFTITPDSTSTYKIYSISNQTLSQTVDKESAQGFVGNLVSALLNLNMSSPETFRQSLGSREYQYLQESNSTYVDMYGILQNVTYYSGAPTASDSFSVTNTGAAFGSLKDYIVYLTDGTNVAYRWVDAWTTTKVVWAKPIAFTPTSYKLCKPRFEKNGILIEGASTNYITNNVSPITGNATQVAGTMNAPDGTAAKAYVPTTANAIHSVGSLAADFIDISGLAIGSTKDVSVSAYVSSYGPLNYKPYIVVDATDGTNHVYAVVIFNPIDGTFSQKALGLGWTEILVPNATLMPCGMWKISWSVRWTQTNPIKTKISHNYQILNEANVNTYAGDGVSGIHLFGHQLEALPFSSSTIFTTGTAATRVPTSVSRLAYADNVPSPTAAMSLVVDCDFIGLSSVGAQRVVWVGGETYRGINYGSVANSIKAFHGPDNVNGYILFGQPQISFLYRYGITWDGLTLKGWVNSSKVASEVITTPITGLATIIYIGEENNMHHLNGHIKRLLISGSTYSPSEMKVI